MSKRRRTEFPSTPSSATYEGEEEEAEETGEERKRRNTKIVEEKRQRHFNALVRNMNEFDCHIPRVGTSSRRKCQFCGGWTYWQCSKCEVFLCAPRNVGRDKANSDRKTAPLSRRQRCHTRYHNPDLFGMACCDSYEKEKYWKYPAEQINNMLKKK